MTNSAGGLYYVDLPEGLENRLLIRIPREKNPWVCFPGMNMQGILSQSTIQECLDIRPVKDRVPGGFASCADLRFDYDAPVDCDDILFFNPQPEDSGALLLFLLEHLGPYMNLKYQKWFRVLKSAARASNYAEWSVHKAWAAIHCGLQMQIRKLWGLQQESSVPRLNSLGPVPADLEPLVRVVNDGVGELIARIRRRAGKEVLQCPVTLQVKTSSEPDMKSWNLAAEYVAVCRQIRAWGLSCKWCRVQTLC